MATPVSHNVVEKKAFQQERELTLKLLHLLNSQNSTQDMIKSITDLIQEWSQCEAVGVRLKDGDDFPYFEHRGFPKEFIKFENSLCQRDINGQISRDKIGNPILECMCGNVLCGRFDPALPFFSVNGSFWTNSTSEMLAGSTEADRQSKTRNRCNGEGYESVALIRLGCGNQTLGLLQMNDRSKGRFSPELIGFLEGIADQIAIALVQRQTKAALLESETLYRSLFDNMLNGFAFCKMILDPDQPPDFLYLNVNDAFERLTGLKNVVGKRVSAVIPGIQESDKELFSIYKRVSLSGIPEKFEFYVESLKMWFSISVYSPQREYFVAVFDVITDRKLAEQGLRESEEKYRLLFEKSIHGILIANVETKRFMGGNPSICRMLGYSAEELMQLGVEDIHPREALPHVISEFYLLARGEKSLAEDIPCQRKDGTVFYANIVATPITTNGLKCSVGFFEDLTERKRVEGEKEKLQSQLHQAQKLESIGRLAGSVSHDFNNMLQIILGHTEIAIDKVEERSPLFNHLKDIKNAASRSAELTGQLLAFARQQPVRPAMINLNDRLSGMQKMIRRLIGEDIDLTWIPGPNLWDVKIDKSQFDQIIVNLAANARDAISGLGKVSIETRNIVLDGTHCAENAEFVSGEFVLLIVTDDGAGMTKEVMEHLFEPFFTTKELGRGTGLGLATVYGIVKQNNGFINVYSEPKEGTCFKIYLPRLIAGESISEILEKHSGPEEKYGGKVLFVEDNEAILYLCKTILVDLGYEVFLARTPMQAIKIFEEKNSDINLLVTDVVMPEMNGKELANRLTSMKPELKCLFMSGYPSNVITHRGILEKDVNFIQKPFSIDDLAKKIREILGK